MRMNMEDARTALERIMVARRFTINTMAKDMGVAWVTLNKFINDEALPQTDTYLRILDYIERNKEFWQR